MRVSPARGPVPLVAFRSPRSDPMVLEDSLRSAVLSVTEPSVTRAFMVSSEPGQHKRRAQPASRESRLTGAMTSLLTVPALKPLSLFARVARAYMLIDRQPRTESRGTPPGQRSPPKLRSIGFGIRLWIRWLARLG